MSLLKSFFTRFQRNKQLVHVSGDDTTKSIRHLVFIHIPRTGGSSAWHTLAATAASENIPIADLYHDAKIKFDDTSKTHEAIYEIQRFLRKHTCLIHHHTNKSIHNYFDQEPEYTTIVRDPIDRFFSEITHLISHIRSSGDSRAFIRGGTELARMVKNPSISAKDIIEFCSEDNFYQNYYRIWFGHLFLDLSAADESERSKHIYDQKFPSYVRGLFKHIACFNKLENGISDLATAMGLPRNTAPVIHINKSKKDPLLEELRSRYESNFVKDYEFLEELGFSYRNCP